MIGFRARRFVLAGSGCSLPKTAVSVIKAPRLDLAEVDLP